MKLNFLFSFLIMASAVLAQDKSRGTIKVKKANTTRLASDTLEYLDGQKPMFKGGEIEMLKFIKKNMKYPDAEKKAGIQGTVYVRFNVRTDGALDHFKIMKGVPGAPGLEAEALRLVSIMPKWTPALQANRIVGVVHWIPIKFTL